MFYLVYKITNKINGKIYIGVHKTKDKNDSYLGSGTLIKLAIKKYGINNFLKEIIYEASSEEEMFNKEYELVEIGKHSYNLMEGGRGKGDGFYNGNATKTRLEMLKDEFIKEDWSKRISRGLKEKYKNNSDFYNKIVERRREYLKEHGAYIHTEESKNKISNSLKGKCIGRKNSNYGNMWITTGKENKLIKKTDAIPNGWIKGRKI